MYQPLREKVLCAYYKHWKYHFWAFRVETIPKMYSTTTFSFFYKKSEKKGAHISQNLRYFLAMAVLLVKDTRTVLLYVREGKKRKIEALRKNKVVQSTHTEREACTQVQCKEVVWWYLFCTFLNCTWTEQVLSLLHNRNCVPAVFRARSLFIFTVQNLQFVKYSVWYVYIWRSLFIFTYIFIWYIVVQNKVLLQYRYCTYI